MQLRQGNVPQSAFAFVFHIYLFLFKVPFAAAVVVAKAP